ncbi:Uncharacterised protein [Psychrobacter phenylpyruvicus]|uniref:Uncharacterized protein n=1 Tax=Psychrobacter phenylpyruvicus TaxID=29432 RepID=A0A379LMC1_9GAMM|nr:Uncharacterised protein [Psychrobacter phenylpyruvicus]
MRIAKNITLKLVFFGCKKHNLKAYKLDVMANPQPKLPPTRYMR